MRTLQTLSRVTPLLAAGLLTGCGGGGLLDDIFGGPVVVAIGASEDGYVTSSGGAISNSANGIMIGDTGTAIGRRGFVRFDIAGIPGGATIVTAVMQMYQADVVGTPYVSMDSLYVDHVNISLGLLPGLDGDDYAEPALPGASAFGVLSASPTLGMKTIDVTARVIADRAAGRPTSDFRLRFTPSSDGDAFSDHAKFQDSELNQAGPAPTLVVTYEN